MHYTSSVCITERFILEFTLYSVYLHDILFVYKFPRVHLKSHRAGKIKSFSLILSFPAKDIEI